MDATPPQPEFQPCLLERSCLPRCLLTQQQIPQIPAVSITTRWHVDLAALSLLPLSVASGVMQWGMMVCNSLQKVLVLTTLWRISGKYLYSVCRMGRFHNGYISVYSKLTCIVARVLLDCNYRIVGIISPWAIFLTLALNRGWACNTSWAYNTYFHSNRVAWLHPGNSITHVTWIRPGFPLS